MPMQRKKVIRSDAQGYAQAERGRHKLYVCLCSFAQIEYVDLIPFARLLRKRDFLSGGLRMETRIALVGIIIEDLNAAAAVNAILHTYADNIVGRMGIPYRQRNVSIISVVIDAPQKEISAMTGKLGMITGVNVKTVYSKA